MYVVCVTIQVKPGTEARFVEATRANHEATRREPGNVRFDVLEHAEDPAQFLLYEAYRSPDDFAAHQRTPHYFAWREAVADLMAEPRKGVKYRSLLPSDDGF